MKNANVEVAPGSTGIETPNKPGTAVTKTIKVDYLARVEGEGGMQVKVRAGKVTDVKLNIFEPPRFFEALLRGRDYTEAPDITARICGICPVAYQMSAVHAMESIFGVKVSGQIRQLRRLLYCGEWIESHVLHIYLLHAPDFLGYQDAITLAKDHPEVVQKALRMKKTGNQLMTLVGGREIHPINVRVGGFYKAPSVADMRAMIDPLKWARDTAVDTARWAATLPFPDFERDYEFVALHHPDEYAINEGRLISSSGLDIPASEYEQHFEEQHVAHSNALHSTMLGHGPYFVGPLARYSLNYEQLSPFVRQVAQDIGLGPVCRNPFKSIIVRGLEVAYACDEALRIIDQYEVPDEPAIMTEDVTGARSKAGVGHAITEAPRGILYHRYTLDEKGTILNAKIVPPTSQNQTTIEDDLRLFVTQRLDLPKEELTLRCEQAIRNYDPCISCATHFLKLEVDED